MTKASCNAVIFSDEESRGCDGVDTNIIEEDTIETSVVMAPYYDNIIIISDHDTY
jgi:hypothetical protein